MASIANDPGGRRRLIFLDKDRNRKAIWLGKVSKRVAEEIKTKVEAINTAAITARSIDGETAEWLGKIGDELHAKLAKVGLTAPRQAPAPEALTPKLGDFLESYVSGRTDIASSTRCNLEVCKARLVEFFGKDKSLDGITVGDAKLWVIWLKDRYAKATISRTVRRAKQFFQSAIDFEFIGKNPFNGIKTPGEENGDRQAFIELETAYKVLEACPDAEWRLIFALSRFGGLRCPSEHLVLTWADLDWERSRFRVDSPKTGVRWVPIFPELKPYFEEAFELAAEGAVHVITRYRDARQNLRTTFMKIIRRAGLKPWPKLFHNLRATRETELAAAHPIHVVCTWIGHTAAVAAKHYLQVTDADFERAANIAPHIARKAETAQNTAQNGAGTEHAPNEKTPELSGFSAKSLDFCEEKNSPRRTRTFNKPVNSRLLYH